MTGQERPLGVRLVAAGWAVLGIAGLMVDAGVALLWGWAWFATADATASDRARTLAEVEATFAVLLVFSGMAFLIAVGLWRLRTWAWWLALGADGCVAAFLVWGALATRSSLLALLIAVPLAVSSYLLRAEVRQLRR